VKPTPKARSGRLPPLEVQLTVDPAAPPMDLDGWADRWVRAILELEGLLPSSQEAA